MSPAADVQALVALFEEACALNREALAALRGGTSPQAAALSGIFERKKRVSEALEREQEGLLSQKNGAPDPVGLERALEAQREAAMLEVQLAEELGNAVPRSGKAIAAYKKTVLDKVREGVDHSI